jgi:hypothetical protein
MIMSCSGKIIVTDTALNLALSIYQDEHGSEYPATLLLTDLSNETPDTIKEVARLLSGDNCIDNEQ